MTIRFPILFEPDQRSLPAYLSHHIDDGMLREVAAADHDDETESHLAILYRVRNQGFVPGNDANVREVLELIRWSEPAIVGWRPGGQGARGHWMRAFACATLLCAAGEGDPGAHLSFNETVAGLIASLDALGIDLWTEAGGFLSWFVGRTEGSAYDEEDAFLGVALLHCALLARGISDASIVALCGWICAREEAESQPPYADTAWLHRVTPHDQRRATWQMLGRKLAGQDLRARSPAVREWVGLIGAALWDG
jgi:hypothetical protein